MSSTVEEQQVGSRSLSRDEQMTELYLQIFTHSNEAIAIIDTQGRYLEQNSAHRDLLGYTDKQLQGKTPAIHMGEETFARVAKDLLEKGEYRGEITSYTRRGEARQIELSAFAVRNAAGEQICFVGMKRDITERKSADEALRRSEAELADFFETAAIGLHW